MPRGGHFAAVEEPELWRSLTGCVRSLKMLTNGIQSGKSQGFGQFVRAHFAFGEHDLDIDNSVRAENKKIIFLLLFFFGPFIMILS